MRFSFSTKLKRAGAGALGLVLFLSAQNAARADSIAYITTGSDQFGTIDLDTGVFTQIGNMGMLLSGLGVSGGNLYGGANLGNTLYEVNPATGALTAVGTGSLTYAGTGSTTAGLYALNCLAGCGVSPPRDLYSVDPTTGAANLIGSTGLGQDTVASGMSSGSGTLYLTYDSDLYSLNTATGAATLIGNTGVGAFGALVFEDGVLWGGSVTNNAVYTLNTSTGAATFVTNTSGGISGGFWGLAPAPVPEPSTWAMMLLGFAGLGFVACQRGPNRAAAI